MALTGLAWVGVKVVAPASEWTAPSEADAAKATWSRETMRVGASCSPAAAVNRRTGVRWRSSRSQAEEKFI